MRISQLADRAGVAPSAIRWYEQVGVLPAPARGDNGYREYDERDLARIRLVLSLRRLGLGPEDAGRIARQCVERGTIDLELAPLIAGHRAAIARQRDDLDRLEEELVDLELTIGARPGGGSGRAGTRRDGAPISVLFVCTGNSARSQIAEALLGRFGGPDFAARSAGTRPTEVHPMAVAVLAEVGIDWSAARSTPLEPLLGQPFDFVVTVCDRARKVCPSFTGSGNTLHWGLQDPSETAGTDAERLEAFRRTRQDLALRLRPFIEVALRGTGRHPAAALVPA